MSSILHKLKEADKENRDTTGEAPTSAQSSVAGNCGTRHTVVASNCGTCNVVASNCGTRNAAASNCGTRNAVVIYSVNIVDTSN